MKRSSIQDYITVTGYGTGVAGLALLITALLLRPRVDNEGILQIAYAIKNGGGYCPIPDSGVPEAIVHKGITILPGSKTGNSYCCGFTFLVAMKAATSRGLLDDKEPYEVKRFQREWYGATPESGIKQLVLAMYNLGIGYEVYALDARAGDFIVFKRRLDGHSAIFLEWAKRDGKIIGIRYRSSQPRTKGVGDVTEYFTTTGYRNGTIIPETFFVGRLK